MKNIWIFFGGLSTTEWENVKKDGKEGGAKWKTNFESLEKITEDRKLNTEMENRRKPESGK